jgi:hypothetical protein
MTAEEHLEYSKRLKAFAASALTVEFMNRFPKASKQSRALKRA